jgi:hypothetical protein
VTQQKSLKRRVRARMAKAEPSPTTQPTEPRDVASFRGERTVSDEALVGRTGRTRGEWFELLEAWGAAGRPHPEIARWLNSEHGVNGWWAQELTVAYEMAIGRRRPGQRPDGYSVSASKTVAVPVERLFDAWVDEGLRAQWLPGVSLRLRTATPHRTARFDWEDGSMRLAVGFTAKGDARSAVALEHQRLPDVETGERFRALWRDRLRALQQLLES